jgi:hypothetical protein
MTEHTESAVAAAIARHAAARAAYDAAPSDSLSEAETVSCNELAETPCTSDAEFIQKLRYLIARETGLWGSPNVHEQFGSVAVAVALHFEESGA